MTAFADLDAYVRLPRLDGLWLSPDGGRLVVGMAGPNEENNRYTTALWEVDPEGRRPARRLTRSVKGEAAAAFTPGGDLLFTSARPRPGDDDEDVSALWRQPAGGGDAYVIAKLPGGLSGVRVSPDGTLVAGSPIMPSAAGAGDDEEVRKQRKESGVSAMLHEGYPVRFWDHDLGPALPRLVTAPLSDSLELRDLTGHVGPALDNEGDWDLSPDGRTVVATWAVSEQAGSLRATVVAIDVATGERRTIADDAGHDYESPHISPDGATVAFSARARSTTEEPGDVWLCLAPLAGGPVRALTADWDRWPGPARWTPDSAALIVAADDDGRAPLWRVDAADGQVTRLTPDNGCYYDVRVSPDGRWAYAMRSAVDSPPSPVRVSLTGSVEFLRGPASGSPGPAAVEFLRGPAEALELPGRLEEVETTVADGSRVRAWLALPHGGTAPFPLVLKIHGGPVSSWNSWSWRWNPWVWVARGYAVLMPDPALSTGYGYEFIKRGWGAWGDKPYTDLMAITDTVVARPDIDETRTAAAGGSFGGYMANWVAGHTDRFDAIVTHASLWALDQFGATTDHSFYWARELSPERQHENSPHRFADAITTPMLVIHGDKDYRVPIGEGLRLWWDLVSRSKEDGVPHKFLYYPDENHWILTPGNAKAWYATVLAFLDHHVRGEDWERPDLFG
ncbi:S9 family peptidase [Paractinoplanes brasiliensis]|uniref:Dipeptidyl aminopeptidase/acylaminoacyl peptidase n=1 Tax=Paractinoplanes brasiliensis TaxID=52695 RepID=A0A4R6JPD3_9ACTN|nr:prolyl oligopeptidase family serine peptidase [Actinoplanes brasiliensis]TDO37231.1 dipeptidyl aminopeptidase/acylaminoacyl peptidase [Actinoplanes brasiliensis]GID29457.1 peptidase S9 [Actinoplanes brasiliensis]